MSTQYVRGKYARAACTMLDWLSKKKITGGPVAQPSKRDPTILVYGMTARDIRKMPKEMCGFAVEGTTKVPDYSRGQLTDRIPVEQ